MSHDFGGLSGLVFGFVGGGDYDFLNLWLCGFLVLSLLQCCVGVG